MVEEEKDKLLTILPLSRVDVRDAESFPVSSAVHERGEGEVSSLLPQMMEVVPAPLLIVDGLHRVVVANAAARSLLDAEQSSTVGYSVSRFLSREKLDEAHRILLSRAGAHSYRDDVWVAGVERGVEVRVNLLEAEEKEYLCITLIDRTDRDRERAERGEAFEATESPSVHLARAHHLEALGHLTGSLAHDFNNLLSVILGSLQGAKARIDRGQSPKADLLRAMTATERSIQSTSQILRYSRSSEVQVQRLDPREVLLELRGLIERTVGARIDLRVEVEETGNIRVGAAQLETAVLNLVLNARDSLDENADGEIRVSLSQKDLNEEQAVAAGLVAGAYVSVLVKDNGSGMSEEVRSHVFEPFYTTKAAGHGTGLGLSSVKALVMKLGGVALIDSVPGKGTSVELLFPVMP